jgi:hypothetical protein
MSGTAEELEDISNALHMAIYEYEMDSVFGEAVVFALRKRASILLEC